MCQYFRAIWHKRWWLTGGRGVPRHFPRAAHTQKRPSRPSHSLIQFCVPFTHFPLPSLSASEKAPPPSHRLLLDPAYQFFCRRHHRWTMKMSFASSASSFSSNSYAAALMLVPALLLLQLVLVLPVAAAGPTSADRQQQQQQQKQQLQMEKRFYAWDEMSAKRSLIPPMSAEIEMDPLEGVGEGPAALVWKRSSSSSHSSRLADQLKRAWRPQQQPMAPNRRLFFGPPRPMPMRMMMMV